MVHGKLMVAGILPSTLGKTIHNLRRYQNIVKQDTHVKQRLD